MACRKAAASAFSTANMRAQFPNIRLACSQLIEVLKTVGPDEVVDMDNALCRESLDVIGGPSGQPACLAQPITGSACLVWIEPDQRFCQPRETDWFVYSAGDHGCARLWTITIVSG